MPRCQERIRIQVRMLKFSNSWLFLVFVGCVELGDIGVVNSLQTGKLVPMSEGETRDISLTMNPDAINSSE